MFWFGRSPNIRSPISFAGSPIPTQCGGTRIIGLLVQGKFVYLTSTYILPMGALSASLCYRAIVELSYFETLWPLDPLAGYKLHWALQLFVGVASLGRSHSLRSIGPDALV